LKGGYKPGLLYFSGRMGKKEIVTSGMEERVFMGKKIRNRGLGSRFFPARDNTAFPPRFFPTERSVHQREGVEELFWRESRGKVVTSGE